ncbi:MAG: helix-turn-helix transcriptional regulator [Clostridiales bacterium]|nr:helix-turn-helix transcriptional regulator [Clostridiales bacterium]
MQQFDEFCSYNKDMEFGNILKELRKENKMTQTEFASYLCTTQDSISLWELGKSFPDIPTLIKIAKFFQVSTDYLLGLEN